MNTDRFPPASDYFDIIVMTRRVMLCILQFDSVEKAEQLCMNPQQDYDPHDRAYSFLTLKAIVCTCTDYMYII